MAIAINETTVESVNVTANELLPSTTVVNYIFHTYVYIVIGILITLVNFPVFVVVMNNKTLRGSYFVLAILFLNSGLTGISAILLGTKRLLDVADGEDFIDHHECVLNMPILLFSTYFLNGVSLLINSVERLCVVALPIYYYTNSIRINYALIVIQYTITIIAITVTAVASLIEPSRRISNFCMIQEVYSHHFFKALILLSSLASLMSVVIMVVVVVILKKKFGAQFLSSHSYNRDLSHFLDNQKRYTQTAIISCSLTFFLVVAPSVLENIYEEDPFIVSQIIVICCVHLRILNSLNMVVLFIYRQRDFRHVAIRCFKYVLCKRKQHVKPILTVGFGK